VFEHVKPINPRTERLKKQLLVGIPLALMLGGYLYYEFKNYPEERQASRFFEALERQDYQEAYRIWQPSRYYTFENFSEDWGPQGVQGPIREFDVTDSRERGTGVLVRVRVNGNQEVSLWVEKKDKSLSFPP
jgi:hypothetical protein